MKEYKIYLRQNPMNTNQVYIGATKNSVKVRNNADLAKAKRLFKKGLRLKPLFKVLLELDLNNKSMILDYIDFCDTKEEAKELESFWIEQFRQWGFALLNATFTSTYTGISGASKACSKYSLNGDYIESFKSTYDASKSINKHVSVVTSVCHNKILSAGGFQWKFGNDTNKIPPIPDYKNRKKIYQYSLEGAYIRSFRSVRNAANVLNLKSAFSIESALDIVGRSSAGFQWRTKKYNSIPTFKKRNIKPSSRGINQIDIASGKILNTFNTATDAIKILFDGKGDRSAIYKVCKGKANKYKNYFWSYNS